MKKTIYINEKDIQLLKESVLIDKLPNDIVSAILNGKTSLGKNPALPDVFEEGFLEKLVLKRFTETKDNLKKIGSIDEVDTDDIQNALNKLIKKCQDIERPFRNQLEKICLNYVIDLFNVPDDTIDLQISLVDEVDLDKSAIILDPIDGDEDFEFDDLGDAASIKDEVFKRRLLDAFNMGAGMYFSSQIKSYISEIYDISPKLCDLYNKIISLNDYLLFTKEDLNMTDENKLQIGTYELKVGLNGEKPKICSQGIIFPILLSETIRGIMDLFSINGLPNDKKKAELILGKSDFLKAEPWDMRIGYSLWRDYLYKYFENTEDLMPYIYTRISKLPIDQFNYLMSEIFIKTKKGKHLMNIVINHAKEDSEYNDFTTKMSKINARKSVISDNIDPEEL